MYHYLIPASSDRLHDLLPIFGPPPWRGVVRRNPFGRDAYTVIELPIPQIAWARAAAMRFMLTRGTPPTDAQAIISSSVMSLRIYEGDIVRPAPPEWAHRFIPRGLS